MLGHKASASCLRQVSVSLLLPGLIRRSGGGAGTPLRMTPLPLSPLLSTCTCVCEGLMFRFLPLSHCVWLLPSSCYLHKAPRAASEAEEKKTPACAARIPMVTEAEGAARDSLYPLQIRQVPCFPGLPLFVWKPVSVSVPRKQQGESHDRVNTARGAQCGLYQGVSWLF